MLAAARSTLAVVALGLAAAGMGCAADSPEDDPVAEGEDALRGASLAQGDMRAIPRPAGMPIPWSQPDSGGWFDERGKCGPTALANTLKLYWIDVSPEEADRAGVHWHIGTLGQNIEAYLDRRHPELRCELEHPRDGAAFLRTELAAGHPVMVWYNTQNTLSSHWVTAVGVRGRGAEEDVVVMSWGRYYAIRMSKLVAAWRNVYGIRNPSVVCRDRTVLLSR